MPEIISRKEARERGLKRYFTGKPCKYGHIGDRRFSDGCVMCSPRRVKCSRVKRNQRNRVWRAKNLEKARACTRDYKLNGPKNPNGELQWLSKAKAMNRLVKRVLRNPNLDHSSWLRLDPET